MRGLLEIGVFLTEEYCKEFISTRNLESVFNNSHIHQPGLLLMMTMIKGPARRTTHKKEATHSVGSVCREIRLLLGEGTTELAITFYSFSRQKKLPASCLVTRYYHSYN